MPKARINLAEVLKAMNTKCSQCGYAIPPSEIQRINFEEMICPKCGVVFDPRKQHSHP